MATAKKQRTPSKLDPTLMDEDIVSEDGSVTVRLTLDLRKIMNEREMFADALTMSRNLPFDMDLVQASDPIALYVASKRPSMVQRDSNAAVRMARQYYNKHLQRVESDSVVLAMLSAHANDALLDQQAKPYDDVVEDMPSGILNIPEPHRDLNDPVENRLRRFYEVVEEHPELMGKFTAAFNMSMARLAEAAAKQGVNVETDDQGFQS